MDKRMAGILMHPTSFPSPYGIGDMGQGAYDFVDFLAEAGQKLWQVLPLGPTGYGDSPYQLFSSFAGQPLIISLDELLKDGLFEERDVMDIPEWNSTAVDYGKVLEYKSRLYKKAYNRFLLNQDEERAYDYQRFIRNNAFWLEDYCMYMACKEAFGGIAWTEWNERYKNPSAYDKEAISKELSNEMEYYRFIQYIFFTQWIKLKEYANDKGIRIIGDMPIFVAYDSADVWAHKELFQLDEEGFPVVVAGVPPDYFSETGQLWGNPLYDWDIMKADDYDWWIARIRQQLTLYDYVRIDHFRGFEAYWEIDYGEETAINGKWVKGPGHDLFNRIREVFGEKLPIIAEDLGVITPEVEELRDDFGLQGMKVLQFAFDGGADNPFLPHNCVPNSICYTGTHDNDTTLGWYATASEYTRKHCEDYLGVSDESMAWVMIKTAYASVSKMAIVPMQDVLELGSEGRMNTPSMPSGNWSWRCEETAFSKELSDKLLRLAELYGR
ncbi:MAG: 4-alpha-glucanotransferase [Lachnospiraceae bacterium]|nr:4-alpha-glucanotransferase [Lachnospiraceae bacterium]